MTEESEFQHFSCTVTLEKQDQVIKITNAEGNTIGESRAVAMKGDHFYNGYFISSAEIEASTPMWEGTLHDLNHKGTGYKSTMAVLDPDITFFVGWNSNVSYDKDKKSLSMKINIVDNTQYASAWKGYVELCELSGQTPNVSVDFLGQTKRIRASELPKDVDYEAYGFSANDMVPIIYNIIPVALSTVFRGACSDVNGCGIGKCSCSSEKEETPVVEEPSKEEAERIQKEREKIIEWLQSH